MSMSTNNDLIPTNNPTPPTGAWGFVYTAVVAVMAILLIVWIYSLSGRLTLSTWRESSEYQLLQQAKDRWGTNFAASSSAITVAHEVNQLSHTIANLENTPSSTPSSTPITTTSSSTLTLLPTTTPTTTTTRTNSSNKK